MLTSRPAVTNYEQALAWLGADNTTSDEFIVSTYTVKVCHLNDMDAMPLSAKDLLSPLPKRALLPLHDV